MTVSRDNAKGEAFIPQTDNVGDRLDAFIASKMPAHVSRSRVKDIVKAGGVTVNETICTSPNYRLKETDQIGRASSRERVLDGV